MTMNQTIAPAEGASTGNAAVVIGIMAYNEESNIRELLDSILAQDDISRVRRIIVVASGCTDRTCEYVETYRQIDSRISLHVESKRTGKIGAINLFLSLANEPLAIVSCADIRFERDSLRKLLEPLGSPTVGMTGAHPVPLNESKSFAGSAVQLMWDLHHRVSKHRPKMGELVAFRNIFRSLSANALGDELSIEHKIRDAGYSIAYADEACISNKGPESLREFVRQRVRWIVANLQVMTDHGLYVSTMDARLLFQALGEYFRAFRPRKRFVLAVIMLEAYCRMLAYSDYFLFRQHLKHRIWRPVSATKNLNRS